MAASINIKDITFQPTVSQFPLDGKGVTIELVGIPDTEIVDLEWLSSDPTLFTFSSSGSQSSYGSGVIDYSAVFNANGSGRTTFTVRDRNSGNEGSKTVYFECSEVSGWPRMWWDPNPVVVAGTNAPYVSDNTILRMSGCSLESSNVPVCTPCTSGDAQDWNVWSADTPVLAISYVSSADTFVGNFQHIHSTTGGTRWQYEYMTVPDTDGALHIIPAILEQSSATTPTDRWVYLNPSAATYAASVNGSRTFTVRASGCTIDSARTPVFTLSGDTSWFSIQQSRFNSSGYWQIYLNVSRNLTTSARDAYISVLGVYDTDGNRYNDLVFHATQNWGSYVFLNYNPDNNMTSGGGIDTIEAVGVNTTVCSISLTYSGTTTPEYWEGVEQPTWTALGNYLTINWPANPFNADRKFNFSTRTIWGDNCESNSSLGTGKWQDAAPAPVQKDIKAAHTGFSVDSGNGHASTYVLTSGCTYDHFTYITGGSFSVTANTFPGDSILFDIPENPTTTARTGYVYFTFYDSDGNTYGPQTITFNQQAGSSPGPGPGPDPETGYVLTTLTISDQEQHRYFVEARPGVVYSAAGQYYKTISACEARYSLYYVNSYGGVDVLPFKEKSWKKSDTVTRFNYSRSFRNNTLEFENVNYMNEIKASWELHTGWMSDESSQRMHELVESTIVYLYDAEEKTYTPVVMTDKKLEYKTYHNQGKKFYNYTVNVEESQSKERR